MVARITYKYRLKVDEKVAHCGITTDLARREHEHCRRWPTGRIEQVGPVITREEAGPWESQQAERRFSSDSRCLRMNRPQGMRTRRRPSRAIMSWSPAPGSPAPWFPERHCSSRTSTTMSSKTRSADCPNPAVCWTGNEVQKSRKSESSRQWPQCSIRNARAKHLSDAGIADQCPQCLAARRVVCCLLESLRLCSQGSYLSGTGQHKTC